MRHILPLFSLLLIPALSQAQTKPEKATPLESRVESRALVQQLLREGKIMRPSEAKRGMKGYALSVFQGVKVERFGVEVLGVLERVQGGGDLVLIKVTSGPVIQRQSGIIQGMSGSPVYLNGKLLGAIAIGFGFPKEPIGGVTPITQMIETALPDNSPKVPPVKMAQAVATTEVFRPTTPLRIANRQIARLEVTRDRSLSDFSGPSNAATLRMRPATQLLQLSGISQGSLGRWKAMLEPYGITPVIGGGSMRQAFGPSSKKSGVKANLAPGAAIGVQLASGDIDATGIGTVTYRLGNRVLAFGHPMFGLGAVSMPMTTAFVQDIFPAYDISFKLGSPIQDVGELQQDTNFAIGGTIGRRAETVPLRIYLFDGAKKIEKKFNVRLIKDPLFTPQLAQSIAQEALQTTLGLDSDKTVRVAINIGLKNGPAIRRTNTVYASEQVLAGALTEMFNALAITQSNPFEKGALTSLNLRVEVIQGRKTARIRRVYADKNRVKAGEKVQISVVMEPTGQPDEEFTRRFTITVPADAPNGVLRVAASSAGDFFSGRARVGGPPPRPGNFRELLAAYEQIGADNELLIQTSTPRRFLLVDRKKVANPPPTWSRLVPAGSSTSIGTFNETQEQRESSEWVLSGLESIAIPVESNRGSDRQRPDAPSGEDNSSSSASTSDSSDASDITLGDTGEDSYVSRMMTSSDLNRAPDFAGRAAHLMQVLRLQVPINPKREIVPEPGKTAPAPNISSPVAPTTTPTASPTATPTPAPTPDAAANNIARPVGHWIQKSSTDFGRGKFDGSLVSDDGTIRVGPKNERIVSSGEPVAWSVAADGKGTIYLGTGHNGRLLKVENGEAKVLYEGPEVGISALALDKDGVLYAGASPGGRVYRFAANGTYQTVLSTNATFIHALAFDAAGNLLVATGGETGALYRVANPSQTQMDPRPFAVLPQKHARSLSISGNSVYVGTSEDAVLYRIDADGKVNALYQATGTAPSNSASSSPQPGSTTVIVGGAGATQNPNAAMILNNSGALPGGNSGPSGNEILALAAEGDNVYFGTVTSGSIYRWNVTSGIQEVFKTPGRAVYALKLVDGVLWAATGETGEVWRISNLEGDAIGARVLDATQPQVLALASAGSRVYASTGNNAAVYEIGGAGQNTFTSNVFDAGQVVRFGTLRAIGQNATFEFRSGNTVEPDGSWSAWRSVANGESVGATGARYAQYRIKLGEGGTVSRVDVAFRAPNRGPRVAWTAPSGGEYFSSKKTLNWNGSDPDKDPLRYKLELRGADGKAQNVELTTATASSQEIDTTKYADGVYTAHVSASDAARNPEDPQSDAATSLPFTIDNIPPTMDKPAVAKDGATWTATFAGRDALSPLAGAEWRLAAGTSKDAKDKDAKDAKAGDWQAAASNDGLFDSKSETVVARLDPAIATSTFQSGSTIEFRLRDAAGNSTTTTVTLP